MMSLMMAQPNKALQRTGVMRFSFMSHWSYNSAAHLLSRTASGVAYFCVKQIVGVRAMRTSVNFVIPLLVVHTLSGADTSLGCSLMTRPISAFDRAEYVFTGEVLDVVGPFEYETGSGYHREAWGLRVTVKETVYLPQSPASYFEVFPYRLTGDCSEIGWDREKLLRYYPIGSQVRVIAKKATLLESNLSEGNIRLEATTHNDGSIAREFPEKHLTSSAESIYEYGNYIEGERTSAGEDPLLASNYLLPDFELRKDLLRLTESSKADRVRILERLVSFPRVFELNYPGFRS